MKPRKSKKNAPFKMKKFKVLHIKFPKSGLIYSPKYDTEEYKKFKRFSDRVIKDLLGDLEFKILDFIREFENETKKDQRIYYMQALHETKKD